MRSDPPSTAHGHEWRAHAFRRTSRLLLVLAVPAAVVALAVARLNDPLAFRAGVLCLLAVPVGVAILAGDPRRYRVLASTLVAALIALCLTSAAKYGPQAGTALGLSSSIVLVAVFLGSRAVWGFTAVTAVLLVAVGAGVRVGLIHPAGAGPEASRMDTWLRFSAFYFVTTSFVAATASRLIARLDRGLAAERAARAAADAARRRSELLAEASRILASSLDYEDTVRRVAQLATPLLGDYCAVDILGTDGAIRRIVAGHPRDPAEAALLHRMEVLTPSPESTAQVSEVLLMRRTVVAEHVSDATLRVDDGVPPLLRRQPELLGLARQVGLGSCVCVPLVARNRVLGALMLVRERAETQAADDVASAEELGRRVAVAIDNGRLFEAAQQAIGVREEFLAIAAHELRTPVTSLQLALQTLLRRARQDRLAEAARSVTHMLDIAERQAVNLHLLVETLLEVSTIAGGPLHLSLSEVDLADAVHSAVASLREPLRASGSTLAIDTPEMIVGHWDRPRVEQVVTNLLSNAIKYGQGGPIAIRVRVEDDVARLVVQDHGIGIAPEAQARIFARFERAASLRNYGGFGLGLYVVQRIVDRLGGSVECASSPHSGSIFTVTLPRRGPSAEAGRDDGVTTRTDGISPGRPTAS